MNEIIKQLSNRRSIRDFTGKSMKDGDLELILKTAQRCPTSINGQQISIVYTKDKEKLKQIATFCGGQTHIEKAEVFVVFVVDFNRTNHAIESIGKKQLAQKSAEGIIVGAVDAGIMLSSLQTAAESLGYGTTAVGAVRSNPENFIKLLRLPKNTFPIVGSTIGIGTKEAFNTPLKPRVDLDSFAFEDRYDDEKVKQGVEKYEKDLTEFRKSNGMDYKTSYKDLVTSFYSRIYYRQTKKYFVEQGFRFEDE